VQERLAVVSEERRDETNVTDWNIPSLRSSSPHPPSSHLLHVGSLRGHVTNHADLGVSSKRRLKEPCQLAVPVRNVRRQISDRKVSPEMSEATSGRFLLCKKVV